MRADWHMSYVGVGPSMSAVLELSSYRGGRTAHPQEVAGNRPGCLPARPGLA